MLLEKPKKFNCLFVYYITLLVINLLFLIYYITLLVMNILITLLFWFINSFFNLLTKNFGALSWFFKYFIMLIIKKIITKFYFLNNSYNFIFLR